jgi:pilus assembly protein CpaC
MNRILVLVLVLIGALGATDAGAQVRTLPPAPATEPAAPLERQVALTVNRSRLVRLPAEARDVIVANPSIVDVVVRTPTAVYLLGKTVGETSVVFLDAIGREIHSADVRVDFDVAGLRQALRQALPNEPVQVMTANQSIVLRGSIGTPVGSESVRQIARQYVANDQQIVSMLRVGSEQQVMLKVRVAEVTRQVVKQLGASLRVQPSQNGTGDITFLAGRTLANPTAFGSFLGSLGIAGLGQLSLLLEALEQTGLVKTLAEPTLSAISGETASFLAGGEFPVPVPQTDRVITIIFKQFGVRVNFTPVVLEPGVISLKVATEVSALSDAGAINLGDFRVSALTVRRADTTVELPSGGSLVIAGLLQNNINNNF